MEHPLIHNVDSLSLEELQTHISDLHRKYSYAVRTNAYLANQISMALETFQNKYNEKQQAAWNAASKKGQDFSDKINIT
jgi:hypothetical protein